VGESRTVLRFGRTLRLTMHARVATIPRPRQDMSLRAHLRRIREININAVRVRTRLDANSELIDPTHGLCQKENNDANWLCIRTGRRARRSLAPS